jgi:intracellular sulfur oxidation DsrE/DsrF family protein
MPERNPLPNTESPRILLHAPTAGALARARSNAANLRKLDPAPEVRIVINAKAVAAALDGPDAVADAQTLVCPNTLQKIARTAPAPLTVLPEGSVLALARMQGEGWRYIRA